MNLQGLTIEGKRRPFSRNLQEGLTRRKKESQESPSIICKEEKEKENPAPRIYKG
jgi:hypothetical protein